MTRFIVALALFSLIASVSANAVMDHLKDDITVAQISSSSISSALSSILGESGAAIPASRLQADSLSSSSSSFSSSSSSSGCSDPDPCKNPVSFGGAGAGAGGAGSGVSVDDAVKPVDEWIKDFRKRMGDGGDLYAAARATVKPLITKLKRTQERAEERLVESNRAILRHVEEQTTQHIYSLLKADRVRTVEDEQKEEQAARILEAKSAEKEARETLNLQMGLNHEQAAAVDKALKSNSGQGAPSQSVLDNIAKLLNSESASAQSAISSALKKASSESSSLGSSSKSKGSSSKSSSSGSK